MAAAAIKAINARIRSNKALDYFCSTRRFGPRLAPVKGVVESIVFLTRSTRLHSMRTSNFYPLLTRARSTVGFWGPASNFTIPLAAIADSRKSPEL